MRSDTSVYSTAARTPRPGGRTSRPVIQPDGWHEETAGDHVPRGHVPFGENTVQDNRFVPHTMISTTLLDDQHTHQLQLILATAERGSARL